MKIILSRKGFDSATGGVPSPIFPSGEMYSLPIPESDLYDGIKYSDIKAGNYSLGKIVADLSSVRVQANSTAHLDPDLNSTSTHRLTNWKPLFGQAGAAEKHLQSQGVDVGDVFLFYGWFKKVEIIDGSWKYVRRDPDQHIIFGWLQIEQRLPVDNLENIPQWAHSHPHYKREKYRGLDSIYISTDNLRLNNRVFDQSGGGIFNKFHPSLCLTDKGKSRSNWRLPSWIHPTDKNSILSYHSDIRRWNQADGYALLRTVGRGQEFVLDCNDYPEAIDWIIDLINKN